MFFFLARVLICSQVTLYILLYWFVLAIEMPVTILPERVPEGSLYEYTTYTVYSFISVQHV
jgi:hypothetical protein